jgi:phenylacetate-CoA ligase
MKYSSFENLSFQSPEQIEKIQNNMLTGHLRYLKTHSRFYRNKLKNIPVNSVNISTLHKLPCTTKQEIENCPSDFVACSKDEIADTVHTSGTSGHKIFFHYTEHDLERLAYNEEQALKSTGITKKDIVLLLCTMDKCFIAGLAYYSGCRKIGASVIRSGATSPEACCELIENLKPTVIIGVPSFILKTAQYMQTRNVLLNNSVQKLICIGEPLRHYAPDTPLLLNPNNLCSKIENLWQADAFSTYALTETVTTFCECTERNGGHLIPELGIIEITDENNKPLPPGVEGEITVTPFHTTGMPLLRYKTGDIGRIIPEVECKCGRKSPRLGPITGRKFQMLKVKGTKFYPNSVYSVLDSIDEVILYQLVAERCELSDKLTVKIALSDKSNPNITEQISNKLRASLRVKIDLEPTDINKLRKKVFPHGTRKPVKFIFN